MPSYLTPKQERAYAAIKQSCLKRRCKSKARCRSACAAIGTKKLRVECSRACGKPKRCTAVCSATAGRIVNAKFRRRRRR